MNLVSVVIPGRNEAGNIPQTVRGIVEEFDRRGFSYEIIIVDDGSADETPQVVAELSAKDPRVRPIRNTPPFGFGNAIKAGLKHFKGGAVLIVMADGSDDPRDMAAYVDKLNEGYDCCFGTRWSKDAVVENYPRLKLVLNRLVNGVIRVLFRLKYNDVTNAFKAYSRETIEGIQPILSHHFNITVELPLKAIVRGYSYAVVPTHWRERYQGKSHLKLKEMGSRYLFIILYVLLEKLLSKGDYLKKCPKSS